MMIRSIFAWAAAALVATTPAFAGAQTAPQPSAMATPPSAEAFYRIALDKTRDHAAPAFATYSATIDGIDCSVEGGQQGLACRLKLSGHVKTKEPMQISYRSSDDRLSLEQQGRSFAFTDGPFLNATWRGVDDLIRWGFLGKPAAAAAPAATPQPAATVDPQSHLQVIAVVSALAPDAYRIEDGGARSCSNGDPGHMVLLTALRDPLRYPLSAAVVNMRTGDLCMVRFGARAYAAAGLLGANGIAELDLANENGYVMVLDEHIAINLRTAGIAVKHFDFGIAFSDYAYPQSIAPVVFTTPAPSPEPSPRTIVSPR